MELGVCGYGYTGSGALVSLLKEFDGISFLGGNVFEFTLSYTNDGLEDLEFSLCTNPSKGTRCDTAIYRFKLLVDMYERSYNKFTQGNFREIAYKYLADRDVHCLLYQGKYNMLSREPEEKILPQCQSFGVGYAAFSPLAQGLLTGKYLNGIPKNSRMAKDFFLKKTDLTPEVIEKLILFKKQAEENNLTPAQFALDFVLKNQAVTTVIVGASSVTQLEELIF